jgi:hypothetical protein
MLPTLISLLLSPSLEATISFQQFLASGSEDGFVELHDLRNQQLLRSVAIAPDGRHVITAAQDGKLFCHTRDDEILIELYYTQASNTVQLRCVIWNLENRDLK